MSTTSAHTSGTIETAKDTFLCQIYFLALLLPFFFDYETQDINKLQTKKVFRKPKLLLWVVLVNRGNKN